MDSGLDDVVPGRGPMNGGNFVTISGTDFDANSGVLFGDMASPDVTFVSATELVVEVPPYVGPIMNPPIPVDVVVAPQNRDPCILVDGYLYELPSCPGGCSISSITPGSGPVAGNNTVTIRGTGFCQNASTVLVGTEQAQFTFVNETELTVVIPPSSIGPGTVDVIYTDGLGCVSICSGCYTYN